MQWYRSLASLSLQQRDGDVAEQRHIEIPPEVFCFVGTGGTGEDSGPKGGGRSINGRRDCTEQRLQELGCIFPANADPRINGSNWRYAWKNCSSGGRQLGADCSTDRAVLLLREVQSTGRAGNLGWVGGFWLDKHLDLGSREVGGTPQMWGRWIGQGVKTSTNENPIIATSSRGEQQTTQNSIRRRRSTAHQLTGRPQPDACSIMTRHSHIRGLPSMY